jgi:hypothetical protein
MTSSKRKFVLAAAAAALSVGGIALGAAPAQAYGANNVEFHYSPDCTGASRVYQASIGKEPWISDTFNSTRAGTAGYGQGIYRNAASVVVRGTTPLTVWNGSASLVIVPPPFNTSMCVNLGNFRNANTHFTYAG